MFVLLLTLLVPLQDDLSVKRAREIIGQIRHAARLYVGQHGGLPDSIETLINEKFLLVDSVPKDPWGNPIVFTRAGDKLTIRAAHKKRSVTAKLGVGRNYRRKTSLPERTTIMIGEAMRAYRRIHGEFPKEVKALIEEPAALLGSKQARGVRLAIASYGAAILIASRKVQPLNPKRTNELLERIEQLSSEDYKTREAAIEEIEEFGLDALPTIREAIRKTKDLEVASRLKRVTSHLEAERARTEKPVVGYVYHRTGGGFLNRSRRGSNERSTAATLKMILTAQENFKSNDLDRNGVNDYWTADVAGLYCLEVKVTSNAIAALNDIGVASADTTPYAGKFENSDIKYNSDFHLRENGVPKPRAGYLYRMMTHDPQGKPYAIDTDDSKVPVHNFRKFAVVATPAEYGVTGNSTYIVNEGAAIFRTDNGGKPVLKWPSAAELSRNWGKLQ